MVVLEQFGFYELGIGIGSFAICLHWPQPDVRESILNSLIFDVPLTLAGLVIFFLQAIRYLLWKKTSVTGFVAVFATLFYPSIHFAICKYIGAATSDLSYYRWVSPFQFAPYWIVGGGICVWATRRTKRQAFGTFRRDWVSAGIAVPVLFYTHLGGSQFILSAQNAHESEIGIGALMFAALSVIILIASTFAFLEPMRTTND
jgi:hypothetical protein